MNLQNWYDSLKNKFYAILSQIIIMCVCFCFSGFIYTVIEALLLFNLVLQLKNDVLRS